MPSEPDGRRPTILDPIELLPQEAGYVVIVSDGADRGMMFQLDGTSQPKVLVGTSAACTIQLTDPMVSRRHAALEFSTNALRLTDLGSTNGTSVNGVAVIEAMLRGGELVKVGHTTLKVELNPHAAGVPAQEKEGFGRLLGVSPEMRRLYPLFAKLAASNVPVVIEGEPGTGKEVLAEALHEASAVANGPFVVFDCTAVQPSQREEELFGPEQASDGRKGAFEQADGGTLLIDEIGEMDLALQAKLLRVIERGEVRHVGGNRFTKVNVRLIAATRRNLDKDVQSGTFREDLFLRLAVGRVELPPLRRRQGDVKFLAAHFWQKLGAGLSPLPEDLVLRFEDYGWPGNVRELINAVARQLAMGDVALGGDHRSSADLVPTAADAPAGPTDVIEEILGLDLALPRARDRVVEVFERRYIERVLAKHGGNVVRAAAASGIARRYFQILKARQNIKVQKPTT
jgi:DNA-binding NtrC family response regulator